jgi:NAD(P)-dependent dehydrogenase (short-subunit alcohol dehydrogenase family)
VNPSAAVTVVTGGSGGIGAAIVRSRARRGERTVVLDLAHPVRTVGEESASSDAPMVVRCDVGEEDEVVAAFSLVQERYGRLDNVVAAAGVMSVSRIEALEMSDWERVARINLRGLLLTCKHALPRLSRGGTLTIVSSAAGLNAVSITGVAYSVTKSAGVHLARVLSAEYASRGIRVNAVCPGAVDTPMSEVFPHASLVTAGAMNPSGRMLQPDDVARVVDLIIDAGESDLTGQAIVIGSNPR